MKCHYEVFEVERCATTDEIKKQYKKLALRYHPDRNHDKQEWATERFKEVSAAYTVLSDHQERKWYDDHREAILKGGDGTNSEENTSEIINLWPYFNASCFSGFENDESGFFGVYGELFQKLIDLEVGSLDSKTVCSFPQFGEVATADGEVLRFYREWLNFVSEMSFAFEDKYNVTDAPNRNVRRAMEKENAKGRETARKSYSAQVRQLVAFVQKRDPRMTRIHTANRIRLEEEEARRAVSKLQNQALRKERREHVKKTYENDEEEAARRRQERERAFCLADHDSDSANEFLDEDEGEDMEQAERELQDKLQAVRLGEEEAASAAAAQDDSDAAEDDGDEDEEAFTCTICSKDFKSEAQLTQHFTNRTHRRAVVELEKIALKNSKVKAKTSADPAADAATSTTTITATITTTTTTTTTATTVPVTVTAAAIEPVMTDAEPTITTEYLYDFKAKKPLKGKAKIQTVEEATVTEPAVVSAPAAASTTPVPVLARKGKKSKAVLDDDEVAPASAAPPAPPAVQASTKGARKFKKKLPSRRPDSGGDSDGDSDGDDNDDKAAQVGTEATEAEVDEEVPAGSPAAAAVTSSTSTAAATSRKGGKSKTVFADTSNAKDTPQQQPAAAAGRTRKSNKKGARRGAHDDDSDGASGGDANEDEIMAALQAMQTHGKNNILGKEKSAERIDSIKIKI